jgi:hypothetical protein
MRELALGATPSLPSLYVAGLLYARVALAFSFTYSCSRGLRMATDVERGTREKKRSDQSWEMEKGRRAKWTATRDQDRMKRMAVVTQCQMASRSVRARRAMDARLEKVVDESSFLMSFREWKEE